MSSHVLLLWAHEPCKGKVFVLLQSSTMLGFSLLDQWPWSRAGGSMLISACQFKPEDLERLYELAAQPAFHGKPLDKLRSAALECPRPWTDAQMNRAIEASLLLPNHSENMPDIARHICRMRDFFSGAVFCVPLPEGAKWYRFLFAMLNPYALFLHEVEEDVSAFRLATPPGPKWQRQAWAEPEWCWQFNPGNFVSAAALADVAPEDIGVVMTSTFVSPRHLQSHAILQPLQPIITALLPDIKPEKAPAPERRKPIPTAEEPLLQEFPWLASISEQEAGLPRKRARQSADGGVSEEMEARSASEGAAESSEDEDAQYDQLFCALEEKRCVLKDDESLQQEMFRTSLLGGRWQLERRGRSVYGVRIDVKANSLASEFCGAFRLNKSASFEQNVYGEVAGNALAKLWGHRITFLATRWEASGKDPGHFPRECLAAYQPPEELRGVLQSLTDKALRRAQQIQALTPA